MPDTKQQAAEEAVADIIFGPEETEEKAEEVEETEEVKKEVKEETEEEDEEYQPDPKPVPEGDESELVEFEWDGQLIQAPVTIKEALMRQQDYTQKTQDIASQRKSIEVQLGEVEQKNRQFEFVQQIQPDILKAQQLEAQAEQAHQYLRDNIDDLSSTDIEKIRLAIEDARRERDDLVQSLTGKQQEFQQAQEQAQAELLKKGTEVLRSKIPNWNEDAQKAVREYALASGYTEAEISSVVDPRQVETLWKASQYDALQQGKAAAVQKVQSAPTIKPKSRNPMPKETQDKLNLRKKIKNPNKPDKEKASLIGEDIARRFGM